MRTFVGLLLTALIISEHGIAVATRASRGAAEAAVSAVTSSFAGHLAFRAESPVAAFGPVGRSAAHLEAARRVPLFDTADGDEELTSALDALVQVHVDARWAWLDRQLARAKRRIDELGDSVSDAYEDTVRGISAARSSLSSEVRGHLETLRDAVAALAERLPSGWQVLGAILYGFFNGCFMGLGDVFRDAVRAPECEELSARVSISFRESVRLISVAVRGLFSAEVRDGKSRRECFLEAARGLWAFVESLVSVCWECAPLRNTVLLMVGVLAVALVLTGLLVATVYGVLVKVAGVVLNVLFGVEYLWRTLKKISNSVKDCAVSSCREREILTMVEGLAEISGFVFQAIVLSGLGDIAKVSNIRGAMRSGKLKALKFEWNPTFQKEWTALMSRFRAIKDGVRVRALNMVARTADDLEYLRFAATETLRGTNRHRAAAAVDDIARGATAATDDAARTVDDVARNTADDVARNTADDAAAARNTAADGTVAAAKASDVSRVARRVQSRCERRIRVTEARRADLQAQADELTARMKSLVNDASAKASGTDAAGRAAHMAEISEASARVNAIRGRLVQVTVEAGSAKYALAKVTSSMDELVAAVRGAAGQTGAKVNYRQLDDAFRFIEAQGRASRGIAADNAKFSSELTELMTKTSSYFAEALKAGVHQRSASAPAASKAVLANTQKSVDDALSSVEEAFAAMMKVDESLSEAAKLTAHIDDPYVRRFVDAIHLEAAQGVWGSSSATSEGMITGYRTILSNDLIGAADKAPIERVMRLMERISARAGKLNGFKADEIALAADELARAQITTILQQGRGTVALQGVSAMSSTHTTAGAVGRAISSFRFNVHVELRTFHLPFEVTSKLAVLLPAGTEDDPILATYTVETEGAESEERSIALLRNDELGGYYTRINDRILIGTDQLRRVRVFMNVFPKQLSRSTAGSRHSTIDAPVSLVGEVVRGTFSGLRGTAQPIPTPTHFFFFPADAIADLPEATIKDLIDHNSVRFGSLDQHADAIVARESDSLNTRLDEDDTEVREAVVVGQHTTDGSVPQPRAVRSTDEVLRGMIPDEVEGPTLSVMDSFLPSSEQVDKTMARFTRIKASSTGVMNALIYSTTTGMAANDPPATPVLRREAQSTAEAVLLKEKYPPPGGVRTWGSPLSGPRPPSCAARTASPEGACLRVKISSMSVNVGKLASMVSARLAVLGEVTYACRAARSPRGEATRPPAPTDQDQTHPGQSTRRTPRRNLFNERPSRLCQTAFTAASCSDPVPISADGTIMPAEVDIGGCYDADPRLGIQCSILLADGSLLGSFRSTARADESVPSRGNGSDGDGDGDGDGEQGSSGATLGDAPYRSHRIETLFYHPTKQWPSYMFLFGDPIGRVLVNIECLSEACREEVREQKVALATSSVTEVPLPSADFAQLSRRARGVRGVDGEVPSIPTWKPTAEDQQPQGGDAASAPKFCPMVIAHRGVSTPRAVENTLEAVYESAMLGLDGVEVDVFVTGSKEGGYRTTILHDVSLDRLLAYDQELGNWNFFEQQRFEEMTERLGTCNLFPGLREVIDLSKALGMRVDVELKPESPLEVPFRGYADVIARKTVEDILGNRGDDEQRGSPTSGFDPSVFVSAFDFIKLDKVRDISRGRLMTSMAEHGNLGSRVVNTIETVKTLGNSDAKAFNFRALGGRGADASRSAAARAVRDGKVVGVYTAYDVGDAASDSSHQDWGIQLAVDAGVHYIETDDPLRLMRAYRRIGCRERVDRAALRRARARIVGASVEDVEAAFGVANEQGQRDATRAEALSAAAAGLGEADSAIPHSTAETGP